MTLPQLKHPEYTLEDWKSWEGRWELIGGVAYNMTPSPSTEHQEVSSNLHAAIWNALETLRTKSGGGSCKVFAAPTDVFLQGDVVQPDLLVVCDPTKISLRGIEGPPEFVVEILSPSTAGKDVTRKWWLYEAAGVPEYLIVDPEEKVGRLLRLKAGRYEEAARLEWGALFEILGDRLTLRLG